MQLLVLNSTALLLKLIPLSNIIIRCLNSTPVDGCAWLKGSSPGSVARKLLRFGEQASRLTHKTLNIYSLPDLQLSLLFYFGFCATELLYLKGMELNLTLPPLCAAPISQSVQYFYGYGNLK